MEEIISAIAQTKGWTILLVIVLMIFVIYSAIKLVKYADRVIDNTKFGGAFVGGAIIAAVTSIPELVTEVVQSSVNKPSIGTADDIGSIAFSTFFIALSIIFFWKSFFMKKIKFWTKITMSVSFALSLIATLTLVFKKDLMIGKEGVFAIGLIPLFFFIVYCVMLIIQWKFGESDKKEKNTIKLKKVFSIKKTIFWFVFWSVVTMILAIGLNWVVDALKEWSNIDSGAVGGVILSITTSLPEIVAFLAFVFKKKYIAGLTSLFGAHIFNYAMTFFGDIAYIKNATFLEEEVSKNWPIAAIALISLFFIMLQAIFAKHMRKKIMYFIFPTLSIITYFGGWVLILTEVIK